MLWIGQYFMLWIGQYFMHTITSENIAKKFPGTLQVLFYVTTCKNGRCKADWHDMWYVYPPLTFLVKRTTSDYSHISKELHRISLVLY